MSAPEQTPSVTHPSAETFIIVAFIVLILTPGVGLLLGIDRATISEAEMRELSPWPRWSWTASDIVEWPIRFQRYFEDHFAFRNRLIQAQSTILWHVLHTSSSETVIAGRGDWLFYADDGGIDDYLQRVPFPASDLDAWNRTLERARVWLAARGIAFLVVIAPDKQMIYPELMPTTLHRMHEEYRADALLAYLRQRSSIAIVDLRPALVAAKGSELLYHRYDTHWNDRGALIAEQQIAARLHEWFPAIRPLDRGELETSPSILSGDKTTMLALTDRGKLAMPGLVRRGGWSARAVYPATPNPYGEDGTLVTERHDTGLPRAVMFRDSFASRLIPYLSEHFSRILYQWQRDIDPELVEQEHPDIVIYEIVARHLYTFTPTPEGIPLEPAKGTVSTTR